MYRTERKKKENIKFTFYITFITTLIHANNNNNEQTKKKHIIKYLDNLDPGCKLYK